MLTLAAAHRLRRAAPVICAGALALGLAACGGGGGSAGADPADAVPASAPIYVQAVLHPDGSLKDNTEAALKKILRTDDPNAVIQKALASGSGQGKINYAEDVEPWLGDQAGLFFTSLSGTSPDGAVVIAAKDTDKARSALEKDAGSAAKKGSYKDVDYWVDGTTAQGVVGDFAVIGSERGMRTVIDTVKGDAVPKIADSADYKKALGAVGSETDALVTAYASTQGVIDALARSGGLPPQTLGGLRQAIVSSGGTASVAKLGVSENAIAIDAASIGAKSSATAPGDGDAAGALAGLPGDSWLGLGVASIGDRLRAGLQQVAQVGSLGGVDVAQQLDAIQQQLGIDLQQDLFSWMGDGGLFVRGTSVVNIGGALVVTSTNPSRTAQAITKIGRLVQQVSPGTKVAPLRGVAGVDSGISIAAKGSPVPVLLAVAGDKFVLGVSAQSVEAAVSPSSTLGDSPSFKAAASALQGVDPTFFFDVAPVLAMADGLGAGTSPDYAKVKAYLDQFGAIAAGSKRDGDTRRFKLVLTLK